MRDDDLYEHCADHRRREQRRSENRGAVDDQEQRTAELYTARGVAEPLPEADPVEHHHPVLRAGQLLYSEHGKEERNSQTEEFAREERALTALWLPLCLFEQAPSYRIIRAFPAVPSACTVQSRRKGS